MDERPIALAAVIPRTDILLTHSLPHDILDLTNRADRAGCLTLAARLSALRPRLHVLEHIHEAQEAHVHPVYLKFIQGVRGTDPNKDPNHACHFSFSMTQPHCTRIVSPTSIVQLKYTSAPLPKPESTAAKTWTRFVLISDNHGKTFPVPDGDVLLHSGDLTRSGTLNDLRKIMAWLYALPHPIKIIIGGNRDFLLDRKWYDVNWPQTGRHGNEPTWEPPESVFELLTGPNAAAANIEDANGVYMGLREARISTLLCVRLPTISRKQKVIVLHFFWTMDERAPTALAAAISRTDILLTHCPPYDILDLTNKADRAGCSALASRLPRNPPSPACLWTHTRGTGRICPFMRGNPEADVADEGLQELGIEEGEQTIFVNASNFPSGPTAVNAGGPIGMAGVGLTFQPMVVDLLE
ncbi:Metallophos domain-containing protein [Mycena sanguinolenta]|uniref:Metallophos domain-containing protein n=1 Tax=Mycena sanguinolenta TaxID=230812 RepID=A0A8H6XI28_9AGAR|nr:Metallophos domain-containing protein [Mycena sanguinolenta]